MWFYRLLLQLCPASFRHEYGGEMTAVFERRLRESSFAGAVWTWLEGVSDVILAASAAHWDLLRHDLRYTLRSAKQAPGFTIVVVSVAALGVAASTAVFSLTDHVLIRPMPFREPDRLVKLWEDERERGYSRNDVSPANYRDWKRMSVSFESMAACRSLSVNLSGGGEAERLVGASVNYELFPLLGISPAIGRAFSAEEDRAGAAGTVVLSDGFWKRRFGGDPSVLGRRLLLDGQPHTIIGVMPAGFNYPRRETEIWTAMRFDEEDFSDRRNTYLEIVGRLKPGVSIEKAKAEMYVIGTNLEHQYPKENEKANVSVIRMRDEISWRTRTMLWVLGTAAFFLLLIAATNLANLLLARATARRREIAVRTALGAGRERIVRQLLTESLGLALVGGAVGVGLAVAGVPLLSRLVPTALPIADTPQVDWRVLLFALAVTIVTGIVFGITPALRATSTGLGLRSATGVRRDTLRRVLVVTQVAASVGLVVSTVLLVRSLMRLEGLNPGFSTNGVLALRTSLPMPKYEDTATRERFYSTVLDDIRALPGVKQAAVISFRPMGDFRGGIWRPIVDGKDDRLASSRFITPGYFSTMGIPLLQGRDFSASDRGETDRVAIVSESFIKTFWPSENGVGRTFGLSFGKMTFRIVGVVADVRFRGLDRESEPQMYFASAQMPDKSFEWFAPKDIVVSSGSDPRTLISAIRQIVARVDPMQPVSDVQTLADVVDDDSSPRRTQLWVMSAFALAAFILAGVGIHGLLAFSVSQRTQEIGLRRALGAQASSIASLVASEGIALAILGSALGIAAAYTLGRSMQAFLVGVTPDDPLTLCASFALAMVMTGFGILLPLIRALRVDPSVALRAE